MVEWNTELFETKLAEILLGLIMYVRDVNLLD